MSSSRHAKRTPKKERSRRPKSSHIEEPDQDNEPNAPSWPQQRTAPESDYLGHQNSGRDMRSTQPTPWSSSGTPSDYNDPPRYQSFSQSQSDEYGDSPRYAGGPTYQSSDTERGSWRMHQGGNNLQPWESVAATSTGQGESSNTPPRLYSYDARDQNETSYQFQRTNSDYDPGTEASTPPSTFTTRPSESSATFSVQKRSPGSDDGTRFGRVVNDLGMLKEDYWKKPRSDSGKASYWNPQRLQNNCLFVSIGYLFETPFEKLARLLNVEIPPLSAKGVALGQLESLLQLIGDMTLVVLTPSYNERPQIQQNFAMRVFENRIHENGNKPFVLGYRRPSGTGHCLVAKRKRDASPGNSLANFKYMCYQNRTKGLDLSHEVKQSYIIFALFRTSDDDDDSNDLQINFYSEGSNDVVYHTQLWSNNEFDGDAGSPPSNSTGSLFVNTLPDNPRAFFAYTPQPSSPRASFAYNLQPSSSTHSPRYTYRQNAEADLPPTLSMDRLYLNN
ncbi:hypothetical protein IFR05_001571 [Cadophora sp. M221]|nr:hypothetical protein IFR05_001571 [Cadophora sp. M221]